MLTQADKNRMYDLLEDAAKNNKEVRLVPQVKEGHSRGGLVTFYMHVSGKNSDTIDGSATHSDYFGSAEFFIQSKDSASS